MDSPSLVPKKYLNPRRHAIVIGGSVAGLMAARVLSESFELVTVLERDVFPDAPQGRPGVPQARHLHALLPRGRRILEEYFPGITAELESAGAEVLDVGNDFAWLTPQGWGVRFPSEIEGLASTRDLLEWFVRARVRQISNVKILQGCDVTGFLGNRKHIEGVTMHFPAAEEEVCCLRGDFIVGATGRHSPLSRWLSQLGLPEPEISWVDAHIGYASRIFRRPEGFRGWRALFLQSAPPSAIRSGIVFPMEGNRWLVTIHGGDGDYPPADDAGFLDFARSLRSPLLYEAIKDAEPLTPIYQYRSTDNRLRHYERLRPWPKSVVVLGDATCALNPVYGQGMTVATLGAKALADCLQRRSVGLDGVAAQFQRRLAQLNRAPWMLATGESMRFRGAEGQKAGWRTKLMHRYIDLVLRCATHSVPVRRRFLQVQGMLKGPATIFQLSVVWQVVKEAFRQPAGAQHTPRVARSVVRELATHE